MKSGHAGKARSERRGRLANSLHLCSAVRHNIPHRARYSAVEARLLTMQQSSGAAGVLAQQLSALRFRLAPPALVSQALSDPSALPAGTSVPLTWKELQQAARGRDARHDSLLWLQPKEGARAHEGAPVPLRLALLGGVALPGLSAMAPACTYDRLPKVRARWLSSQASACARNLPTLLSNAFLTPWRGAGLQQQAHAGRAASARVRRTMRFRGCFRSAGAADAVLLS